MHSLPGYEFSTRIHEGRRTLLSRGRRADDGVAVIAKTLRSECGSPRDVARLRHEHGILARFDDDRISRALEFLERGPRSALIIEDFGGVALRELIPSGGLEISLALHVAVELAHALSVVHGASVLHKDVKPANVIVSEDLRRVVLSDFSIASSLTEERASALAAETFEGTLAYISPEQTGRMNRPVDHRSDLYSLGVTLYELATGQLPFISSDPIELVHAHVARLPVSPSAIRPALPEVLSDVITRLLAKNAEDRYQSAAALLADLERIQREWTERGSASSFELAAHESYSAFTLPSKLYGREDSVKAVYEALERVCAGSHELLLLAGPSGIGKSALIQELNRPMIKRRGYLVRGKCEQFERGRPYSALSQALRELVRYMLLEPDGRLRARRDELLAALKHNAAVVIDLVPEFERVLGPQPPVTPLPLAETANRFVTTISALFRTIASERSPLVVLLDDLQWSDVASLTLIEQLTRDPEVGHALWVGAYRDNEVLPEHPLAQTIDALRERGAALTELTLAPLDERLIAELLADTLHQPSAETQGLAGFIREKTGGNPFFVRTLLSSLHEQGQLRFAPGVGWRWELEEVQRAELPDDVVGIVVAQLSTLDDAAQGALRYAACIGNRFALRRVAALLETQVESALEQLWPAVRMGLIRPLDDAYKYLSDDGGAACFDFAHDRVQESAYSLLSEEERARVHLALGRAALPEEGEQTQDQLLFELVGHFNRATSLLTTAEERGRVVELNLLAARRAKRSTAYRSARSYLEVATGLLPEQRWRRARRITSELYRERVETEYLAGAPERALEFFEPLLEHCSTPIERAELYALRATLETNRGELHSALAAGRAGLLALGVRLPRKVTTLSVLREFLRFQALRKGASSDELLARPELTDETTRAALEVMVSMTAAAYFIDTELASLLLLRVASESVKRGLTEVSAYGLIGVGLVLSGAFGRYKSADEYGQLARDMNERFGNVALRTKIALFWATFMMVWTRPFSEVKQALREASQLGVENGDLIYAVYSSVTEVFVMVIAGDPLDRLHERCEALLQFVKRRGLVDQTATVTYMLHAFGALRGDAREQSPFDEDEFVRSVDDESTPLTMFYFHLYRAMTRYIGGDDEAAYRSLEEALLRTKVAFGSAIIADLHFYEGLIRARAAATARGRDRRRHVKAIRGCLSKLATWAASAPANYAAREALVRAELGRINGVSDALTHYNRAVTLARTHSAPNVEALACECALRYVLTQGEDHGVLARHYLADALDAYRGWGAREKVVTLAREFSTLTPASPRAESSSVSNHTVTRATSSFLLDADTIMRASQAISGELELDKLLRRLSTLLVQNAGAQRGVVLLARDDELFVEAEASADGDETRSGLAVPLAEFEGVPTRLVQFVARLREDVVLGDATADPVHGDDPYIVARRPRSVLCTPILHQGQLACVVYLENALSRGAFTPRRLTLIKQLGNQIAISLTNARLYEKLNEARLAALSADRVKTRFLMNMSHELRTPLNAILGYTELVAESIADGLYDTVESDLRFIHRAGVRLLRSVSSILELTRIETDAHATRLAPVTLEPLVRTIVAHFETLARSGGNTLSCECEAGLATLVTDERMLRYCLTTLLDNACRFTSRGEIRLRVLAEAREGAAGVLFEVTDSGIGIGPDALRSIFEMFTQEDDSTTRRFEGTGVSLAVAHRFCEMLGGDIEVDSEPARGSVFRIWLPRGIDGESRQAPRPARRA